MKVLNQDVLKKAELMENKFLDSIQGTHILLRKTNVHDAADIFKWRSGTAGKFLRQPDNYSVESQKEWILSRGNNEINYIIIDIKTQQKVGAIGIYDVNDFDKVANVGRLLLDDVFLTKSTPFGLEALLLMYDYVLNIMQFRKITGDILVSNEPMFKLQKFLGMKQEGYLEKHTFINGNYEDLYIMSIFTTEFNNVYKKKIAFLLKNF